MKLYKYISLLITMSHGLLCMEKNEEGQMHAVVKTQFWYTEADLERAIKLKNEEIESQQKQLADCYQQLSILRTQVDLYAGIIQKKEAQNVALTHKIKYQQAAFERISSILQEFSIES